MEVFILDSILSFNLTLWKLFSIPTNQVTEKAGNNAAVMPQSP